MDTDCLNEDYDQLVLKLWEEAFSRQGISTSDNFFELGGHSLIALTVSGRLGHLLDIEVPLRMIFDYPVLSDYSSAARRLVSTSGDSA